MKNGEYIFVIAPDDYPGKKYRNRYCYEHTLVVWRKYGRVPAKGEEIHHLNGNKHDNSIQNVQLITSDEHKKLHGVMRAVEPINVKCAFCGQLFKLAPKHYNWRKKNNQAMHCSRSCSVRNQHKRGLVNLVGCVGC
jgi:hypothetical protein